MFASTHEAEVPEPVEQRVAVARLPEQQQAGEHDRAASQLLLAAREDLVEVHVRHDSVWHTLCQWGQYCASVVERLVGGPACARRTFLTSIAAERPQIVPQTHGSDASTLAGTRFVRFTHDIDAIAPEWPAVWSGMCACRTPTPGGAR